jgi:hypothetical protein
MNDGNVPVPASPGGGGGIHTESEDYPWTRVIPDHPPRTDSSIYVKARAKMNELAKALQAFFYGNAPYEDHHGGGVWLKDESGWFLVRNIAGIEWSAQFCADPAKVDQLRLNVKRLYARFPEAVQELGIQALLDAPITDSDGVAAWTDSICNASVPLPKSVHTGTLPTSGGVHHYPAPVAEIAFFKYDDFNLWVTDAQGNTAAVAPVAQRGSGDGRVRVLFADPQSIPRGERTQEPAPVVAANHQLAQRAFGDQYAKLAEGSVPASDPLAQAALPG